MLETILQNKSLFVQQHSLTSCSPAMLYTSLWAKLCSDLKNELPESSILQIEHSIENRIVYILPFPWTKSHGVLPSLFFELTSALLSIKNVTISLLPIEIGAINHENGFELMN